MVPEVETGSRTAVFSGEVISTLGVFPKSPPCIRIVSPGATGDEAHRMTGFGASSAPKRTAETKNSAAEMTAVRNLIERSSSIT